MEIQVSHKLRYNSSLPLMHRINYDNAFSQNNKPPQKPKVWKKSTQVGNNTIGKITKTKNATAIKCKCFQGYYWIQLSQECYHKLSYKP